MPHFHHALGTLTYLILGMHPDIAHTLTTLSCHTANPGFKHLHVLNRLSHTDTDWYVPFPLFICGVFINFPWLNWID